MTETIHPGVYVDETTTGARPIPGVPTSTSDLRPLLDEWLRAVRTHRPEWTDLADADPGTTLIELLAFVVESERLQGHPASARARVAAARVARSLDALVRPVAGLAPLQRPNYFSGRLLDAAAFSAGQNYHREKSRRLHRYLLGSGIVCGLDVHVDERDAGRVVVEAGFAIDANGEQLALPCSVCLAAPVQGVAAFVTLRFGERAYAPVPMADGSSQMSMTEEGCIIGLHADVVAPAIALARLVRVDAGWRVDTTFVALRVA